MKNFKAKLTGAIVLFMMIMLVPMIVLADTNENVQIISNTDEQGNKEYIVYIQELMQTNFASAVSNSESTPEQDLTFVTARDGEGNYVAQIKADAVTENTAYLYVKAGVNNDGEYIRYDLNEANNTRLIEVDVEKIDCTERLLGRYEIICDGMETRWEEVWLSTPYCCDFGYKTPYTPSDYDYPESPLLPPDKINGGGITVIPGVPTIPTISGDTKHCTPKSKWNLPRLPSPAGKDLKVH